MIADQELIERRAELLAHERGQLGTEHDAKAVLLDIPAHDVLGAWPAVLTNRHDGASIGLLAAATAARVAQHHSGRAVTEQGNGDEVGYAHVVIACTQTAQIHRQEENVTARQGLGDARCARETADTSAAAEPKDGQALDLTRKREGGLPAVPRGSARPSR